MYWRLVIMKMLGRGRLADLAWTPEGLITASSVGIWVYDDVNAPPRLLVDRPEHLVSLAVSATMIAAGTGNGTVRVWKRDTGSLIEVLESFSDLVGDVAFSPDGTRLAACSEDGSVLLWDTNRLHKLYQFDLPDLDELGPQSAVGIAFSPNGTTLAAASSEGMIYLWDVETGRTLQTLDGDTGFLCLTYSADGSMLAAGDLGGTVWIWQVENGRMLHQLSGHTGMVDQVTFSPDGTILVAGVADGALVIWDVRRGNAYDAGRIAGGCAGISL
jgi:WD40 repeat protein